MTAASEPKTVQPQTSGDLLGPNREGEPNDVDDESAEQSDPTRDLSLIEVINHYGASVRLTNCIMTLSLEDNGSEDENPYTVGWFLDNHKVSTAKLLHTSNFGRKSFSELCDLVALAVEDGLTRGSISGQPNLSHPTPIGTFGTTETRLGDLTEILDQLKSRQKDVIFRRYGLFETPEQTLEEVGQDLGVTRESIRQLESKARRKLRTGRLLKALVDELTSRNEAIVGSIFVGRQFLRSDELDKVWKNLNPQDRFLVGIVHGDQRYPRASTLESWLNSNLDQTEFGWLKPGLGIEPGRFEEEVARLEDNLKETRPPIPISSLIEKNSTLDLDWQLAAIEAAPNAYQYLGYLFSKRPGSRSRRRAQAHLILTEDCGGDVVEVQVLLRRYAEKFPAEACSGRDLQIVMDDTPHLFLDLGSSFWCGICQNETRYQQGRIRQYFGHSGDDQLTPENDQEIDAPIDDLNFDEEGLSAASVRYLKTNGPSRMATIRDSLLESEAPHSRSSIPAILITTGAFIRVAPGLYALPEQAELFEDHSYTCPELLNRQSCSDYVHARFAGEPLGSFPAWTIKMEQAWVEWARKIEDDALYESLLEVASPQDWAASEASRAYWTKEKELRGRRRIRERRPSLEFDWDPPSLLDLVRIAVLTNYQGYITWLSANRATGKRFTDKSAGISLAILSLAGVLVPQGDWDGCYLVGDSLADFKSVALSELYRHGGLSQDGTAMTKLGGLLGNSCPVTWLEPAERRSIIGRYSDDDGTVIVDEPIGQAPPRNSELDQRLRRRRRQRARNQLSSGQ